MLLWGTQWYRERTQLKFMRGQDVFRHDNVQAGYSKYYPNQHRTDVDSAGVPFTVTINKQGFRGEDYAFERPDKTLRILTLGASSTFGFGNRDNETYPYLLSEILNERLASAACGYSQAQVINLGIPHLDSSQIAELFVKEGLRYQPDAVTIYSGYNNTLGLGQGTLLRQWSRHWLVINFIRVVRQHALHSSKTQIRVEGDSRSRAFVAGLQRILDASRQQGITVLPITQQVRSLPAGVIRDQTISYDHEMRLLKQRLEEDGTLTLLEGKVLIHQSITRALRLWAQENSLELIDAIELLDDHRYLLTTYVHLAPLANELVALAIADGLAVQLNCPQLATPQSNAEADPMIY